MRGYRPLIIGHRGAKGLIAENTRGSFRRAFALGADMVEFDVHLTRDNVPVVMHDFTVTRTTNGRGRILEMTLARFRKLRCANGEAPPTLEEVLRLVKKRRINVELKTVDAAKAVARVFEKRDIQRVLFSAFRWKALTTLRTLRPDAILGVLLEHQRNVNRAFTAARALSAGSIHPSIELLTPAFMARAKAQGLKVLVYGLRDDKDALRCFELRADGVFVDYPDQAIRLFKRWSAQAL
ncbi:MAG: glycerophosphodiester phosphodiesterase family protein [Fibrobacterota bacterium]